MEFEAQPARLIPVAGISGNKEAEARATSALLAVLTIVRPFSKALLTPLGATRVDRATVEAFTEVAYDTPDGAHGATGRARAGVVRPHEQVRGPGRGEDRRRQARRGTDQRVYRDRSPQQP